MKIKAAFGILVFAAALLSTGCIAYVPYSSHGEHHHAVPEYQRFGHQGYSGEGHHFEHREHSGDRYPYWNR